MTISAEELAQAEALLTDPTLMARLTPVTLAYAVTLAGQEHLPQELRRGIYTPARHVQYLGAELAVAYREAGRLIIHMPPRHGKSLLVSRWFPIWVLDQDPTAEIMIGSYNADFAAELSGQTRDIARQYQRHLRFRIRTDSRAADHWMTTQGGGLFAAGRTGGFSGRGAKVMIIDDPLKDRKEAESEAVRKELHDFLRSAVLTRLQPDGVCIVMHTRWHEEDGVGFLLSRQARIDSGEEEVDNEEDYRPWRYICLPALAERDDPLGRQEGEALWPERFSRPRLLGIKRDVDVEWDPLYQGRTGSATGTIFRRYWWRYWAARGTHPGPVTVTREDGRDVVHDPIPLPDHFDEVFQSWDTAIKDHSGSDYTCGQVWGRVGKDHYLLAQRLGKWNVTDIIGHVESVSRNYPEAKIKLIEAKASGPAVINALRSKIGGVVAVRPEDIGSKEERARGVAWLVEGGNVLLPHPRQAYWVNNLLAELTAFPANKDVHDDQVDALTQALGRSQRRRPTTMRNRTRNLFVRA